MQQPDPKQRLAPASRTCESYGRTDGLTETCDTTAEHLALVNARAKNDDISTLGQAITALGEMGLGQRHEVIRVGERTEIPKHVRVAVWFRDGGKCETCADIVQGVWHLDHIKPWSAGGSDDTTNLRVLCELHNIERSNYVDWNERAKRAATWWCYRCWDDDELFTYRNDVPLCGKHEGYDTRCRVVRSLIRERRETGAWPTWHQHPRSGIEVIAYCAHCDAPGLTRWVL